MTGQIPGYEERSALQTAEWKPETEQSHKGCVLRVLNAKHCLVIGATGSGKTFWMARVADLYLKRFIFVNPQLEREVEKICTVAYDDANELLEGVLDGNRRIEFIPDENDDVALVQLEEIRRGLFDIAAEMNIQANQFWLNFILDECQIWLYKGSRNDADNFARRGRRFGIRSFFLSQRPQSVSSTTINNVDNQIIFRTGSYESVYFKQYKIPIEAEKEWLEKPFHYVLWDGFTMQRCEPIEP
jgi:hypothetical protein